MSKLTPENHNVKWFMDSIKRGHFNIPRFQRNFVWPADKIVKLLSSIENNYPIGIILSANSDGSVIGGRNKIFESLLEAEYEKTGKIVIDGQQRLTSISIAYFANEIAIKVKKNFFNDKKTLNTLNKTINNIIFINNVFYDREQWIEEQIEATTRSKKDINDEANLYKISNNEINVKVRKHLDDKAIYMHVLSGWSNKEIIEIFTRMNGKTKALTHVELMNGAMFNSSGEDFELLDFISAANTSWKNWGIIKPELFVQLIKIYFDLKVNKGRTVTYKSHELVEWASSEQKVSDFIEYQKEFKETIKSTISVMNRKLDIYSIRFIPKEVYFLTVFALNSLIDETSEKYNGIFKQIINRVSIRLINGDYASSPNMKALDDINKFLVKLIYNDTPSEFENQEYLLDRNDSDTRARWEDILFDELRTQSYKNRSGAIFKLALSVLSKQKPKLLFEDQYVPIEPTEAKGLDYNIHHFFPTHSKFVTELGISNQMNGLANMSLMTEKENKYKIRDKNVDEYLAKSREKLGDDKFKAAIKSHMWDINLINAVIEMYETEYDSTSMHTAIDNMLNERLEEIYDEVKEKFFIIEK